MLAISLSSPKRSEEEDGAAAAAAGAGVDLEKFPPSENAEEEETVGSWEMLWWRS